MMLLVKNCGLALLASAALTLLFALLILPALRRVKASQPILKYVGEHAVKAGTPTLGGVFFVLSIPICFFVFGGSVSHAATLAVCVFFGFGIIGFLDDFIKIKSGNNLGLKAYQKLVFQCAVALIAAYFGMKNSDLYALPFSPNGKLDVIPLIALALNFIIFIATVNGVNLTDGLDGLASKTVALCLIAFGALVAFRTSEFYFEGNVAAFDKYGGILLLICVGVGAVLAFSSLNCYPAKVFMGDTGSLALGGLVASVAVFTDLSLFLPFFGIAFVVSCISVIVQVTWFKLTKKRVFLMAPYHHHLQMKGIHENRIGNIYSVVTACVSLFVIILSL